MPFKSKKQMAFLEINKPEVAKKFAADARAEGQPVIEKKAKKKPKKK